ALQIADVAADAGEILPEVDQEAVGRVLVVIECVVVQRIAERRGERSALGEFFAHGQRSFTVAVAPETEPGVRGGLPARCYRATRPNTWCIRRHPCRRGVESQRRVIRIVVTVVEEEG